ncbi:MAG: hypothetical protein ACREJO_00235 [Phycisphaerales bacterium]
MRLERLGVVLAVAACAIALGGCQIAEIAGAMLSSAEREGNKEVKGQYGGLAGKSYAVIVAADRSIQADFPELIPRLSEQISMRLAGNVGASAFVPPAAVLEYQYSHPRWVTMTRGQLAEALGVERLVYVDMAAYRLNDPGNQYLWNGGAAGTVSVCEVESAFPDEPAFQSQVKVAFPDKKAMGPTDISRIAVHSELSKRFAERTAWLFYKHEEPNKITY